MAEVLENQAAFSPGDFPSTGTAQQRFALRLLGRRYGRPEIPAKNWLTFISAGLLTLNAGVYLGERGQAGAAQAAFAITGVHALLALLSFMRKLRLKRHVPQGHPHACHLNSAGELELSLEPGETVAARLTLDTKEREWIRWAAGLAQTFWGLLLSGIMPVFVMGEGGFSLSVGVIIALTFVGTLLFGKGIRDIWGLRFAKMLFITNRRMVMVSGPGEARSLPWTYLKQRPVVVGREGAGATLAFALIPLVSVGRLPALGLWGKDDMDESAARDLAAFAVQSRQELMNHDHRGTS